MVENCVGSVWGLCGKWLRVVWEVVEGCVGSVWVLCGMWLRVGWEVVEGCEKFLNNLVGSAHFKPKSLNYGMTTDSVDRNYIFVKSFL